MIVCVCAHFPWLHQWLTDAPRVCFEQVDNVESTEGISAVMMKNLRLHHPTLYYNVVMLMITCELAAPLDFLALPGRSVC